MFLLDTNIASLFAPRRRREAGPLIDWMRRNDRWLFLSTATLLEIESGILKLRREGKGQRAAEIEAMREGLIVGFSERLLPLDAPAALAAAHIADAARPAVIEIKDLIIAATAHVHGLTVLTRNLRHFRPTGVRAVDPMRGLPPDVPR